MSSQLVNQTTLQSSLHQTLRQQNCPHPFRFHDMWFSENELEKTIKNRWKKSKNDSDIAIVRTLKNLSEDPTKWSKIQFGNVKRNIKETRAEIERIRLSYPNISNISAEIELTKKN